MMEIRHKLEIMIKCRSVVRIVSRGYYGGSKNIHTKSECIVWGAIREVSGRKWPPNPIPADMHT